MQSCAVNQPELYLKHPKTVVPTAFVLPTFPLGAVGKRYVTCIAPPFSRGVMMSCAKICGEFRASTISTIQLHVVKWPFGIGGVSMSESLLPLRGATRLLGTMVSWGIKFGIKQAKDDWSIVIWYQCSNGCISKKIEPGVGSRGMLDFS